MPIYEYHCRSCNDDFEALVAASRRDQGPDCPSCGGQELERKLSAFAAHSGNGSGSLSMDAGPAPGCGRCGDPNGPCGI